MPGVVTRARVYGWNFGYVRNVGVDAMMGILSDWYVVQGAPVLAGGELGGAQQWAAQIDLL